MDLLLVEDDHEFRKTAARWMERQGHQVMQAGTGEAARALVRDRHFDVAVLDLNLPDSSGLKLYEQLREQAPDCEYIILTGSATVETAVEAMRTGVFDYLTKPFSLRELEQRCRRALEVVSLRKTSRQWQHVAERAQPQAPALIGNSAPMRHVQRLIERMGPSDRPVLVTGETGTGKELVARALHAASPRAAYPLVALNCAAFSESLFESELFGHEKGAFTSASSAKPGLIEVADGGTLLIDEVGELPLVLQPKLLRVLEDGLLRRVGATQERRSHVRIIAATNRDLVAEARAGRFREDLLYRLNVLSIAVPPLRERVSDLEQLVAHLLPHGWEIEDDALQLLARYSWPGNVRQLRNVLDRAMVLAESQTLTADDLPPEVIDETLPNVSTTPTPVETLHELERQHVLHALREHTGNKSEAARSLGIHRRKLYRLLARLGINDQEVESTIRS